MNKIEIPKDNKEGTLTYGDLFIEGEDLYILSNPTPTLTALISLETGTCAVTGTVEIIKTYIKNRKLQKVPVGTKITLTAG